jgi:hypothetical protein
MVARPKAICYGRTSTVNGRAFAFRHLVPVGCVTFGADFGRLQPAKQQCGCHGLKRRHSDLFPPSRNTNREASCYTTEQECSVQTQQGNRRGCPTLLQTCPEHEHEAAERRVAPSVESELDPRLSSHIPMTSLIRCRRVSLRPQPGRGTTGSSTSCQAIRTRMAGQRATARTRGRGPCRRASRSPGCMMARGAASTRRAT